MSDLNNKLKSLSSEKRELFETLLKQRGLQTPVSELPAETVREDGKNAVSASRQEIEPITPNQIKGMDFSLFFFSEDGSEAQKHKYRLLLEAAKKADENGFSAIWTPERHFDAFGGPYPNPSVLMAALAMITENIELRAGSVVLPLHNPLRVVEEWSVVDNLSGGRVALSFATGWHRNDFILAPAKYENRKESIVEDIATVVKLWKGDSISLNGVDGEQVSVKTYPRPLRQPLPVWLTSAGNVETFKTAGTIGANILTGLTGQSVEGLAEKLKVYRQTLEENGFDPARKKVALMLHTFIGKDLEQVKNLVRPSMKEYLRVNIGLHEKMAQSRALNINANSFSEADQEIFLEHSFERYFQGSSLMGTIETGKIMIAELKKIGITEIACLIDFGLSNETVSDGLIHLNELRQCCV